MPQRTNRDRRGLRRPDTASDTCPAGMASSLANRGTPWHPADEEQIMCCPHRTGITQLTDDELLLFDFMFDKHVEQRHLERDSYAFHMNVRYNHNLDSEHLRESLAHLAAQGLVLATPREGITRYSLTPLGGRQWELERRPRWDDYCEESERTLCSGRTAMTVLSPSRATAETFWDIGVKSRLWKMGDGRRQYWRIRNHRLIPWRDFSAIHVLAARGASYTHEADWETYEANRIWWRDITELDRLWTKLT